MPKVSIIIPVYNRAHLLTKCLNSVQAQSFRDYEVILVDDGSTDNIQGAISGFPVRYFRQERQGPAGARNKGLEMAVGKYIAFLDSDDTLTRDSLRRRVEVLDGCPEAGWCCAQAYNVDENEKIIGLQRFPVVESVVRRRDEELRSYLLEGNHYYTSTIMVRRNCFAEAGKFNVGYRAGSEDLELWIRLAKKYDIAFISEPLAKYRVHPQNFCASRDFYEWEQTNSRILESIFKDSVLGGRFAALRPRAYFRLYTSLSIRAKNRGDSRTSLHYLFKAWKIHPAGMEISWMLVCIKAFLPKPILTLGNRIKRLILNPKRRNLRAVPST